MIQTYVNSAIQKKIQNIFYYIVEDTVKLEAKSKKKNSRINYLQRYYLTQYKNKIFYFASEASKRTFAANPEQFTKGVFSHL